MKSSGAFSVTMSLRLMVTAMTAKARQKLKTLSKAELRSDRKVPKHQSSEKRPSL